MKLLDYLKDQLILRRVAKEPFDYADFEARQRDEAQRVGAALVRNPSRPDVNWDVPQVLKGDFFHYQDEHSRDVADLLAQTRRWHATHWTTRDRYGLPAANAPSPSYTIEPVLGGAHFRADANAEHWVYLVSRWCLPPRYVFTFTYVPHTIFNEQLQLDFGMDSLANRRRFILKFNEKVFFQVISRGYFLAKSEPVPFSLPLHEPVQVRLEVTDDVFSLSLKGATVLAYQDRSYRPHPARLAILGWNGRTAERPLQTIDFEIRDLKLQVVQEGTGR